MVIVALVLIVMLGMLYNGAKNNIINESINMMRNIALNPREHGRPDEKEDIRLPFFMLRIDENGEVKARGGGYYDLSDEAFLNDLVNSTENSGSETGRIDEYNLQYLKTYNPEIEETMIIFSDTSSGDIAISGVRRACIFGGIAAFLLFFGVSVLLSKWVVKPVEKAWDQQRQFIGDASHELKTPLTVIMTNAEMLRDSGYTEEQKSGFVSNIQKMSLQMRGLVESMLELSRLDNDSSNVMFSRVDLSKLIDEAVLPFEPLFFENRLSLNVELAEGIYINGNEAKLRELLEILLDNAVKYSYKDTQTDVRLTRQSHNAAKLEVASRGDEISAEDLKNIFKRFYRVDKARSMNHSYGLGLAIAESVVKAHKGKISAESENGINTFTVTFPMI